MSAAAPAPDPADRWADDPDRPEVESLSDRIREAEADLTRLRAERRERYLAAMARGVDRAEVARWAGVTSMAVKFDVEPRQPRAKKASAPASTIDG